ncbi:MAG: PEP-CTERM sorting domain-containing protein [Phycisphaerae bacterium]
MINRILTALSCAAGASLASATIVPVFQDRMVEVVGSIALPGGGSMVDDDHDAAIGFGNFDSQLLCSVASTAANAVCRASHASSITPMQVSMSGAADSNASANAGSGETSSGNAITGMLFQFDLLEPQTLRFVGSIEEFGGGAAFAYLKLGNDVLVDLPTGTPASVDVTLDLLPGRYEFMTCTGSSAFVGEDGGFANAFASVSATISIVPEPTSLGLLVLGSLALLRRR